MMKASELAGVFAKPAASPDVAGEVAAPVADDPVEAAEGTKLADQAAKAFAASPSVATWRDFKTLLDTLPEE